MKEICGEQVVLAVVLDVGVVVRGGWVISVGVEAMVAENGMMMAKVVRGYVGCVRGQEKAMQCERKDKEEVEWVGVEGRRKQGDIFVSTKLRSGK
jgi:hypothetical protein